MPTITEVPETPGEIITLLKEVLRAARESLQQGEIYATRSETDKHHATTIQQKADELAETLKSALPKEGAVLSHEQRVVIEIYRNQMALQERVLELHTIFANLQKELPLNRSLLEAIEQSVATAQTIAPTGDMARLTSILLEVQSHSETIATNVEKFKQMNTSIHEINGRVVSEYLQLNRQWENWFESIPNQACCHIHHFALGRRHIFFNYPLIGRHTPHVESLPSPLPEYMMTAPVRVRSVGTQAGLREWVTLRQSTSRTCSTKFTIELEAGDGQVCIGITTLPTQKQIAELNSHQMPTMPGKEQLGFNYRQESKVWNIFLPTGGRYIGHEQAPCLEGWRPIQCRDRLTLNYNPINHTLGISVLHFVHEKNCFEDVSYSFEIANNVKSDYFPLHFLVNLAPGNQVKFIRESDKAKFLIRSRALFQAPKNADGTPRAAFKAIEDGGFSGAALSETNRTNEPPSPLLKWLLTTPSSTEGFDKIFRDVCLMTHHF